jgi:transcription elongation factor
MKNATSAAGKKERGIKGKLKVIQKRRRVRQLRYRPRGEPVGVGFMSGAVVVAGGGATTLGASGSAGTFGM